MFFPCRQDTCPLPRVCRTCWCQHFWIGLQVEEMPFTGLNSHCILQGISTRPKIIKDPYQWPEVTDTETFQLCPAVPVSLLLCHPSRESHLAQKSHGRWVAESLSAVVQPPGKPPKNMTSENLSKDGIKWIDTRPQKRPWHFGRCMLQTLSYQSYPASSVRMSIHGRLQRYPIAIWL